jgi:tetratricopeptide (TPR) repeat protein
LVLTAALLALAGLLIHHTWLTPVPVAGGDWRWIGPGRLNAWFPWPSIWDTTYGFGQKRFLAAYLFPLLAITGGLNQLGVGFGISEKLVFFLPFAVLTPVGAWFLAREVTGSSRWSLLSALVFAANPAVLIQGRGHVTIALSVTLSTFTLVAYLRAMRAGSLSWATGTGLLLGLQGTMDLRAAFITVLLMLLHLSLLALTDLDPRRFIRTIVLLGTSGAVFLGSQAFWILPVLTYHGDRGLPTPDAPNFPLIQLGAALAAVHPYWTGGVPTNLAAALHPVYLILPLVTLLLVLRRRLNREVLWLALAGLLLAFLAKTDNPPAGAAYDWMFAHVPGWKLFREGSKFQLFVALVDAVLVSVAIQAVYGRARTLLRARRRILAGFVASGTAASVAAMVAISTFNLGPLEAGLLGTTTVATPVPQSFLTASKLIESDADPGPVLWFGGPDLSVGDTNRRYGITSSTHGLMSMLGNSNRSGFQADPFQDYCTSPDLPYCYLEPDLFAYLVDTFHARYAVAPRGPEIGTLPSGVTRSWLKDRLTLLLGTPEAIGPAESGVWLWRLNPPGPADMVQAPAVTYVNSGPWSTSGALPAIAALTLPVVYRDSFDRGLDPGTPPGLPRSVTVLPRLDQGCQTKSAVTVGVMVQSPGPTAMITQGGRRTQVPRLTTGTTSAGWTLFGPLNLDPGFTALSASGATVGPCVVWSELAAAALEGRLPSMPLSGVEIRNEALSAQHRDPSQPWLEIKQSYDPGWQLANSKMHLAAEGAANLYYLDSPSSGPVLFTYSTARWELLGKLVTAVSLLMSLCVLLIIRRRPGLARLMALSAPTGTRYRSNLVSSVTGGVGVCLLLLCAVATIVEWSGLPSTNPAVFTNPDPYSLDVGFGAAAIGLLVASLLARTVRRRAHPGGLRKIHGAGRWITSAISLLVAVALTGCGAAAPGDLGQNLSNGRLAALGGLWDTCVADYSEALTASPHLVEALAGRGFCYTHGGRNPPAGARDYGAAIDLSPVDPDLWLGQAFSLAQSGAVDDAVASYTRAAEIPSARPLQFVTALEGLISIRRVHEAALLYPKGLARFPTSGLIHVGGAAVAVELGREHEARREYELAVMPATSNSIESSADRAFVLSQRAEFYSRRLLWDQAAADATAAIAMEPGSTLAFVVRARAELQAGEVTAGINDLSLGIGAFVGSANPDAQAGGVQGLALDLLYEERARAFFQSQDLNRAEADLERALSQTAIRPDLTPNPVAGRSRLLLELSSLRLERSW